MLADPKWDHQTRTDPLSLDSLIAWLEQQPADGYYEGTTAEHCLLAQWLRSMDPKAHLGTADYQNSFDYVFNGRRVNLGHFGGIAVMPPRQCNFGAALERARALAAWRRLLK